MSDPHVASPPEREVAPAARSDVRSARRELVAESLSVVFDRVLFPLALLVAASWLIVAVAHVNDRSFIA